MNKLNRVVWHEGMFIQPHHFQQHDRYLENVINHKQTAAHSYLWGFSHLSLDLELLAVGKIGVESCKGIFPDGTPFDIPSTDLPPKHFEIPEGLTNTTLYLALPIRQRGVAEIGEKEGQLLRYKAFTLEVEDMVEGSNITAEVPVGSLACQIVTDEDDLSHYTYLPIACIKESRAHHQITLDQAFIGTWLDAQQVPSLAKFIIEIHDLLVHRAKILANRLTDTQQGGTAEIIDFMLLQLCNKYEPVFQYLRNKQPLHPEYLYFILIQLLGEMATFTSQSRRPIALPQYQHHSLFETFKPIIQALRKSLSTVLEQNATSITLENRQNGLWVGVINDKTLLNQATFVLAVYADAPNETLRTRFPSQVKIGPVEYIRTLVSKALPGISITSIAVAPRQIPYHANFCYFTLNRQHELWQTLEKSGGIALHVGSQLPGLKLELWAIKG